MERVKVGCCGFPRGMKHYFSRFKLVEVQQTFYQLPRIETAMKWRQIAPDDFEFTIKAWQLITHPPSSPTYSKLAWQIPPGKEKDYGYFKPTGEVNKAWHQTKEIARVVNAKIIVFQCPASFVASRENIDNMKKFFQSLARDDFLFAWEPRRQWDKQIITSLCHQLELIHCVDPLEQAPLYGTTNYFRLHGGPGYRHSYSNQELEYLRQMTANKESYVLFNNITMYDDALRFTNLFLEK
ncbi:DUF72 domain-containing protein [Dehalococcoidales bacterium]|nr:DUF72 domain-containing protein [Dehalococcoidales bacterium]